MKKRKFRGIVKNEVSFGVPTNPNSQDIEKRTFVEALNAIVYGLHKDPNLAKLKENTCLFSSVDNLSPEKTRLLNQVQLEQLVLDSDNTIEEYHKVIQTENLEQYLPEGYWLMDEKIFWDALHSDKTTIDFENKLKIFMNHYISIVNQSVIGNKRICKEYLDQVISLLEETLTLTGYDRFIIKDDNLVAAIRTLNEKLKQKDPSLTYFAKVLMTVGAKSSSGDTEECIDLDARNRQGKEIIAGQMTRNLKSLLSSKYSLTKQELEKGQDFRPVTVAERKEILNIYERSLASHIPSRLEAIRMFAKGSIVSEKREVGSKLSMFHLGRQFMSLKEKNEVADMLIPYIWQATDLYPKNGRCEDAAQALCLSYMTCMGLINLFKMALPTKKWQNLLKDQIDRNYPAFFGHVGYLKQKTGEMKTHDHIIPIMYKHEIQNAYSSRDIPIPYISVKDADKVLNGSDSSEDLSFDKFDNLKQDLIARLSQA